MEYVVGAAILLVGVLTGAAITQTNLKKLFRSYKDSDEYVNVIREEE